jgi:hypothetical protein
VLPSVPNTPKVPSPLSLSWISPRKIVFPLKYKSLHFFEEEPKSYVSSISGIMF